MPEIAADVLAFKDKHPGLVCEARGRVIEGDAYVDGEDEIKKALKAGMPVVIGYRVKGSFYQAGSDGMVPYPESGTWQGQSRDGHCRLDAATRRQPRAVDCSQ